MFIIFASNRAWKNVKDSTENDLNRPSTKMRMGELTLPTKAMKEFMGDDYSRFKASALIDKAIAFGFITFSRQIRIPVGSSHAKANVYYFHNNDFVAIDYVKYNPTCSRDSVSRALIRIQKARLPAHHQLTD
jgi:hypothetical protein